MLWVLNGLSCLIVRRTLLIKHLTPKRRGDIGDDTGSLSSQEARSRSPCSVLTPGDSEDTNAPNSTVVSKASYQPPESQGSWNYCRRWRIPFLFFSFVIALQDDSKIQFKYFFLPSIRWLFFQDFIFLKLFQVHSRIERKVQRFRMLPLPPTVPSLPHYQGPTPERDIRYNRGTNNDTSLSHNVHRLHYGWCYTVCEFEQMCNQQTHHYGIGEHFHCPKTPPCLPYSSLCAPNPLQPLIVLSSPQFCLSQNVIPLDSNSMYSFQTGYFCLVICI